MSKKIISAILSMTIFVLTIFGGSVSADDRLGYIPDMEGCLI